MQRRLFDYELPPELIASRPTPERDGARLLVVEATARAGDEAAVTAGGLIHAQVRELERWIPPGALLVVNDTRVVPARLFGRKRDSGGRVELLLVRRLGDARIERGGRVVEAERWRALGRSSKPLRPGATLCLERDGVAATLEATIAAKDEAGGAIEVLLWSPEGTPLDEALDALGHVPLPPYVHRPDDGDDRARYQTVFARARGAVAAPTAGLHLSEPLLDRLRDKGIHRASVTLHVGLGTFQPVSVDDFDEHPMHAEVMEVGEEAVAEIDRARDRGAPVVAVGTTVVRALESAADPDRPGRVRATAGETRLLIQPGYPFRVVDQLLTNFHLPQSTLLALVAAFAGRERVLGAYREAVAERYRFFSYGDAMLLRGREAGESADAEREPRPVGKEAAA